MCVSREALIKTRTQLVSRVRGYVRARLGRVVRATPETLPKRVRQALLEDAEGLPAHLERVLAVLDAVSEQIAEADVELRLLAEADARMTRLMTVPGVGPVTAARFVAAIDDVGRFPSAASVASYLGLVPGEDTTGFRGATITLGAGAGRVVTLHPTQDGSHGALGEADRRATWGPDRHHGAGPEARACSVCAMETRDVVRPVPRRAVGGVDRCRRASQLDGGPKAMTAHETIGTPPG